jgi:hypothetical protein
MDLAGNTGKPIREVSTQVVQSDPRTLKGEYILLEKVYI